MELKEIPYNGWMFGLNTDEIKDRVFEAVDKSKNTKEVKEEIIKEMVDLITECTTVIHHANTMETLKECTCAGNCGDET